MQTSGAKLEQFSERCCHHIWLQQGMPEIKTDEANGNIISAKNVLNSNSMTFPRMSVRALPQKKDWRVRLLANKNMWDASGLVLQNIIIMLGIITANCKHSVSQSSCFNFRGKCDFKSEGNIYVSPKCL